jgi:hypothetical protein
MGYWNDIDPKETKQIIQNERDTFHSRAQADADLLNQGRFKKETAATVTGASGGPTYPRQPPGSPYADNPVPPGELDQMGFSIGEMEPVGSHAEIERSLQRLDAPDNGSDITAVSVERESEPSSLITALTDEDGSTPSKQPATSFVDPSEVAGSAEGVHSQSPSPSATHSRKSFRRF